MRDQQREPVMTDSSYGRRAAAFEALGDFQLWPGYQLLAVAVRTSPEMGEPRVS